MEAPPATGNQVQNKLEITVVTSGVRSPRAKKKCRRRKLLQLLGSKYRTSRDYSSNFWCEETQRSLDQSWAM